MCYPGCRGYLLDKAHVQEHVRLRNEVLPPFVLLKNPSAVLRLWGTVVSEYCISSSRLRGSSRYWDLISSIKSEITLLTVLNNMQSRTWEQFFLHVTYDHTNGNILQLRY